MQDNALSRYQKCFILFLVCAPVMAMIIMGGAHLVHQTRLLLSDARWIVGDALADYLGRPVRVGHARLAPFGTAVIEKLEIADGTTFARGKMISVRKITVHYDAGGVILRGMGAAGVKSVEVTEPVLRVVRKRDGTLNLMELVKPTVGPPGPPFRGRLVVVGGRISFVDQYAGRRRLPPIVNLHDINASFDAFEHPVLRFQWSATGQAGCLKSVRGLASYDGDKKTLSADIAASGASLPLLAALAGATTDKFAVRSGTLDAAVGVSMRLPAREPPHLTGAVRLADVEAALPGLRTPVRQINGTIVLTGAGGELDLSGSFAGSRAAISGSVTGFANPVANLSLSVGSIDVDRILAAAGIARLPRGIRIAGASKLSADVGGSLTGPEAQAQVTVPGVSAFGLSAQDVQLSAGYRAGVITVHSLTLGLNGARVKACGSIDTTGAHKVYIRGSVRRLSVTSLGLPAQLKASGLADLDFAVGGSVASPEVFARVRATGASVKGVAIPALSAELNLDVHSRRGSGRLALNAAGGLIRVRGQGRPGRIDLAYSAEAVDTAVFGPFLNHRDIGGTAYAAGRISGNPADPAFSGAMEVFKGRYEDIEADYLRAVFSGNRREVTASDAVVRLFPAELRFAGTLTGLQKQRLEFRGEAHVKRLETELLSRLLERELDVTGTIAGDFSFSGAYVPGRKPEPGKLPIVDTTADGELSLEDGLAYGFLINSALAKIDFRDNVLTVSEAAIASGDAQIALSGTLDLGSKQANLAFGLTGF
ncbi:MAG: hypothetical protein ACP5R5_12015, partial [Armatimonadota bacterium]